MLPDQIITARVEKTTKQEKKQREDSYYFYLLLKMAEETVARRSISASLSGESRTRFCSLRRYSPHEAVLEYSFVTVVFGVFILLTIALKALSQQNMKDALYN